MEAILNLRQELVTKYWELFRDAGDSRLDVATSAALHECVETVLELRKRVQELEAELEKLN